MRYEKSCIRVQPGDRMTVGERLDYAVSSFSGVPVMYEDLSDILVLSLPKRERQFIRQYAVICDF